jgi:hypothetical protein
MRIETENGTVIELYDSIKATPRAVYTRFQRYALQGTHMGDKIEQELVELAHWVREKRHEEALTKIENLTLSLYAIKNDHSFEDMEWGSLVYAVNGQPFVFSEENVRKLIEDSGIDEGLFSHTLETVKKN